MIRLILRFWPILLPFIAVMLWNWRLHRLARKRNEPVVYVRRDVWLVAGAISLAIALVLVTYDGLTEKSVKGTYIPPHLENGVMIPGRVEP